MNAIEVVALIFLVITFAGLIRGRVLEIYLGGIGVFLTYLIGFLLL